MILFGRKKEVVIGNTSFNGDDLTINFEVPFDDGPEPNISSVEIYNISDSTLNRMKSGQVSYINAGYENNIGAILLGTVKNLRTEWQGVDKITKFDIIDSGDGWLDKEIKKSYKANTYASTILNELLPMTGLKLAPYQLPLNKVYKGGKSFDGPLYDAIEELIRDCMAVFTVNKNTIYIKTKFATIGSVIYVDYERGLIGSPTRIEKDVVTGTDKDGNDITTTISGWSIITLLNHKISTNSLIEVKSNTANGVFRVDNGVHTSDDNEHYTEVEAYPL